MPAENVSLVERAIAAVNARDIEGYLACCSEEVRLSTPLAELSGDYQGQEAIKRFFADIADTTEEFRLTIEQLQAVGPDRVLAFLRVDSSGRASGIPTAADTPTGNIYDFLDGKIACIRIFLDRQEALRAAGISE